MFQYDVFSSFDLALYMLSCIEMITYSQNIIVHSYISKPLSIFMPTQFGAFPICSFVVFCYSFNIFCTFACEKEPNTCIIDAFFILNISIIRRWGAGEVGVVKSIYC